MTPARPAKSKFLALSTAAFVFLATCAVAQLESPEAKPTRNADEKPSAGSGGPQASRTGAPQAPAASGESATPTAPVEQAATQPATPTDPGAKTAAASAPAAPAPDVSAFIAALSAAERANENLAARLAQMETSSALQRQRDQEFIRDMIKGVLLLAGGMAAIGMLALVAIVYLQLRSTKQQAITFAAQLQALTSHVALPPPPGAPTAAIQAVQDQFESTAHKIEQKLNDLESMASGLPGAAARPQGHAPHSSDPRPVSDASDYTAPIEPRSGTSRGEKSSDLLSKANTLLQQQQPEVALAYLDQAIMHNPHNSQAHLKKGAALERLNRLNDAILAYDRAVEADPALSVAYLAKAGVLNKLQRYSEALKCYETALAQQGGLPEGESSAA